MDELIKLANDAEIKELISKTNPVFDNNIGLTKIEAELAFKIQENRSAIHMFRSENRIMKLCPKLVKEK